ncbi:hypothetical protein [Cryptosporangium sp. NPDC048952]|uniref:hypothetical protein n=1 Tax=Cryptosporangium sp. NPDC048952 TaxID=3363961 RepID=UPI003715A5EE
MAIGGFDIPLNPNEEQIETARLFLELHRPDHRNQCPYLTCAVGPAAPPWPCSRWIWAAEVARRCGLPIAGPDGLAIPPLSGSGAAV